MLQKVQQKQQRTVKTKQQKNNEKLSQIMYSSRVR